MKLTKKNIPVTFKPFDVEITNLYKGFEIENTEFGIYQNKKSEWFLTDIRSGHILAVRSKKSEVMELVDDRKDEDNEKVC